MHGHIELRERPASALMKEAADVAERLQETEHGLNIVVGAMAGFTFHKDGRMILLQRSPSALEDR